MRIVNSSQSEYDLMMRRKGSSYSDGHRAMYDGPIALLRNRPARILEIGCGAGYGVADMLRSKCVTQYLGIDPDAKCIDHLNREYAAPEYSRRMSFHHGFWPECQPPEMLPQYDFGFCIECIEHVERQHHAAFLGALRPRVKHGLFVSTPNAAKSGHGVLTPQQMAKLASEAGFTCQAIEWQWTVWYLMT